MENDTIEHISLYSVYVPFKEAVKASMQTSSNGLGMAIPADEAWFGGDFVICKLQTKSGAVGYGEAFVWLPETGVSPEQVIDTIQHHLAHYVLGESPFRLATIRDKMNRNVTRNEVAKGLIDNALYDLQGQLLGLRVAELIGGAQVEFLPMSALIPLLENVDDILKLAEVFKARGHKTFRFKLGEGVGKDVEIIKQAREVLGSDVKIRVDYNQAYSVSEAVKSIRAISEFDIEVVEQATRADHYVGMAEVQKQISVPAMAHEGCFSLQDIYHLGELGAIQTVGINSERPGGMSNAIRAIHYAEQKGFGVVIHNQPLGPGSAWQMHLASAFYTSLHHEMELFGHIMMEHDLMKARFNYHDGGVDMPTTPGFGFEIDEAALRHYSKAKPVEISMKEAA